MKFQKLLPLIAIVFALGVISCTRTERPSERDDVIGKGIDTTVHPGDDFFKYAHGTWIRENPIPVSESGVGIYLDVQNEVYNRLRGICESASANPGQPGSGVQQIGDLWASGMDSLLIEKQRHEYLNPYFDRINAIKTKSDILAAMGELQALQIRSVFSVNVGQDDKNSEKYALFIYQAGLGLPDRDYYFNTDSRTASIRTSYVKHISKMLALLDGDSVSAIKRSKAIMSFETSLAKASRKLEDLRDPYKNYNKYSFVDLSKKFKGIDWSTYFAHMRISTDSIIVGQPEFVKEAERLVSSTNLDTWKGYLTWNLLRKFAQRMSNDYVRQDFSFYGTVMQGRKEMRPRWKRMLDTEERYAGDLLGQEFVKNYFPEQTKQRYVRLVDEMIAAYREHIENLSWMGDSTKAKAITKLASIRKKVGYPEKWKDYSSLTFSRESYLKNAMAGENWLFKYNTGKLGKPVDRDEWGMTPQTWNAYYNPSNNEIVLPAAIFMIPGMKDEDVDDAVVYGYGAASTIGHELTHGFDDQGSQYDDKGNLKDWWTNEDREKFEKKVDGIVDQFNGYVVLDSMHINGEATAGENIADLGGVMIGLDAFRKTNQFKNGEKIAGFTPLQRYFLGYALSWRIVDRDEDLAQGVMSDVHSPPFLRVNGPLANVPEFYEAFGVTKDRPMWRPDSLRVKIW